MPKLIPTVVERNKECIETAALKLFCSQGFHGTSVRQIAQASGVSIGNIYNYYRNKEEILETIIAKYHRRMMRERNRLLDQIQDPFDPSDWRRLARKIRRLVQSHGDYWRLMYIDVTEFDNRHFRASFTSLLHDFKTRFDQGAWPLPNRQSAKEAHPAVAASALWMQLFNYFLVENLFHGNQHFGVSDERFVEIICGLYLGNPEPGSARPKRKT